MPRKVRELRQDLSQAGFVLLKKRGKGSHTVWRHPALADTYTLSGDNGDDAAPYQEKHVRGALQALEQATEDGK